jgi:hypothetical protein
MPKQGNQKRKRASVKGHNKRTPGKIACDCILRKKIGLREAIGMRYFNS